MQLAESGVIEATDLGCAITCIEAETAELRSIGGLLYALENDRTSNGCGIRFDCLRHRYPVFRVASYGLRFLSLRTTQTESTACRSS